VRGVCPPQDQRIRVFRWNSIASDSLRSIRSKTRCERALCERNRTHSAERLNGRRAPLRDRPRHYRERHRNLVAFGVSVKVTLDSPWGTVTVAGIGRTGSELVRLTENPLIPARPVRLTVPAWGLRG
jgi:hypothetical protein